MTIGRIDSPYGKRLVAAAALAFLICMATPAPLVAAEPSYALAAQWWPDQAKQWTGVGWPRCSDEFVILWNGNVQANSYVRAGGRQLRLRDLQGWEEREGGMKIGRTGVDKSQANLLFAVGDAPDFGTWWDDDGQTAQQLLDGFLPVVTTTKLTKQGTVTIQSFASRLGSDALQCRSGEGLDERPVVLWTRVKLTPNHKFSGAPTKLWISLTSLEFDQRNRRNTFARPAKPYRTMDVAVLPEWFHGDSRLQKTGSFLMEGNGVRMVVPGSNVWSYQAHMVPPRAPSGAWSTSARDHLLSDVVTIELTKENGFEAVVAYPGTYIKPQTAEVLAASNIDGELARTVSFWNHRVTTAPAMSVDLPERELGSMLRAGTIQVLSGLREEGGSDVLATGILTYPWTGGWASALTETMEQLMYGGQLSEARSLLDYFYSIQLTSEDADALGPAYRAMWDAGKMQGHLNETGDDLIWVTGHGALLKAISDYYLLTRDEAFLTRWLPGILSGLEWIRSARAFSGGRFGIAGLMPPGRTTDADVGSQTAFGEAYTYWGFSRAVHLLEVIGHPQAPRWHSELRDYRDRLLEVIRSEVPKYGKWQDRSGKEHPFVPFLEFGRYDVFRATPEPGIPFGRDSGLLENEVAIGPHQEDDYSLGYYPDTGPQTWGAVGIFEPEDPLLDEILHFLGAAPAKSTRQPMMQHGITMLEPAYSWDIPIYFLRNDSNRFLEGFYSCAARCFHRKTYHPVEFHYRNHNYSTWVTFTRNLRNMLLHENFSADRPVLELFRNAPTHWFDQARPIRIDNAPTEFGPVSFSAVFRSEQKSIEFDITPPTRNPPARLTIHVPLSTNSQLRQVLVDGQILDSHGRTTIDIGAPFPPVVHVVAYLQHEHGAE